MKTDRNQENKEQNSNAGKLVIQGLLRLRTYYLNLNAGFTRRIYIYYMIAVRLYLNLKGKQNLKLCYL